MCSLVHFIFSYCGLIYSSFALFSSYRFGHVNYEDPHFNVGLPVFSIHGNHDDPAGVVHFHYLVMKNSFEYVWNLFISCSFFLRHIISFFLFCGIWQQDNLSAIDILSACNLVNYFGKMNLGGSGVGQISLYPILMRKVGAKNL